MNKRDKKRLEASVELIIASRYAESGMWGEAYAHIWNMFQLVPDDAQAPWAYSYRPHDNLDRGEYSGFGTAPDPIKQIQSVLYDNRDVGVDYINIHPEMSDK